MTTPDQLTQLKFPIGPFTAQENINESELDAMINTIASAPADYRAITKGLAANDLKKTYREGGWNVQQLVNHVADMQLLHFFRMKKALTEADYKEITLVNMDAWAHTSDGLSSPIADSLDMFEGITKRFVHLMRSLNEQQQAIAYYHPVRKIMLNQKQAISMSAWHVKHHLAHLGIALGAEV
ncbi:MAG: DinB family protein [Chryseosolibacter sp.]